jgi:hypothetical protein
MGGEDMSFRRDFSPSPTFRATVEAVAECLRGGLVGQPVTYEALNRAAGCDVQQNRYIVGGALKLLNRQHGLVFVNERDVGYTRLSSTEGINEAGFDGLKKIRAAARNGQERLANAVSVANSLTPQERRLANQRLAAMGIAEQLTKTKVVRGIATEE